MKKMHHIQKSLTFVSSYHDTSIIAECTSFRIKHLSIITIPYTRLWAGCCGALLRALPAPPCPGTARTRGTTPGHVGPTTYLPRKVTTHARGELETTRPDYSEEPRE